MKPLQISAKLQVMGVINTTPDSFSDGGRFDRLDTAFCHARELIDQGAHLLDIGGESSRPGSQPVDSVEEIRRTVPLIKAVREISNLPISIDTNKPEVMRAAVEAGANLINSIWALRLNHSLEVAAELGVPVCLMHMQGSPDTMQQEPRYNNVVDEVKSFLSERIEAAVKVGISPDNIIIDPGFGFGKTIEHNLALLKSLPEFRSLGVPVLVGLSRKSMIGKILNRPADQRLYGSLALAVMSAMLGADIIRVHDVAETVDAIKMVEALGAISS